MVPELERLLLWRHSAVGQTPEPFPNPNSDPNPNPNPNQVGSSSAVTGSAVLSSVLGQASSVLGEDTPIAELAEALGLLLQVTMKPPSAYMNPTPIWPCSFPPV